MTYHWTLDYVLDRLTLTQVAYFYEQAVLFYNPEADNKPDKDKFHSVYGKGARVTK